MSGIPIHLYLVQYRFLHANALLIYLLAVIFWQSNYLQNSLLVQWVMMIMLWMIKERAKHCSPFSACSLMSGSVGRGI